MIWQPIETAPRDGRDVLIWNDRGMWMARFEVDEGAWLITNGKLDLNVRGGLPTHWQPLPAPPQEGARDG